MRPHPRSTVCTILPVRYGPPSRGVVAAVRSLGVAAVLILTACGSQAEEPDTGSDPGDGTPAVQDGPTYSSERVSYRVQTVVEGLEHPWSLSFLDNGDMLVTERSGRLRLIRNGALIPEPIQGTPEVWARGQGGLLDVVLHPDFATNRWVYLTYSKPVEGGATTALYRARWEDDRLVQGRDLFVARAVSSAGQHFGSRLAFDGDGHVFMTIGDRGDMEEAQNRSNHMGTTLRLTDEGGVPRDNPFVGVDGVLPEIWTWGNRSPQGLTFHPGTGDLWQTEHGPQGGDELNLIQEGLNYGWPTVTHGVQYGPLRRPISEFAEMEGMESPVTWWDPSIGASGLALYTGSAIPEWTGNLFAGGLAETNVVRITLDGTRVSGEEKILGSFGQRIRDVRDGPDGYLYLLVDAPDAPLVRLEAGG